MGDDLIKQGYNIYSYYWTIIALFVFLSINFFSRNFKVEALNIQMMVSIVSFLFGFFISITFTMLFSRVIALKDHLAGETGRLVNLFHLSKFLGDEFHKKVINRIDNYTIKTLKYYTNYEAGREEIYGLYDDLRSIPKESRAQNSIYIGSFLSNLADLEEIREKLEYLTSKRAEWSLKFADLILGSLLIVLLFLNRGDPFTNILFIILSTIVVFIILIIEDYDSLRIGDYIANISNSEQLFDLIERERYYPSEVIKRVKLVPRERYRIGIEDPYTKHEKIFSVVYSKDFGIRIRSLVAKVKFKKH